MGDYWLTWLADELRTAGADVHEYDTSWKTRSRSSGGFNAPPLGVSWHHTAGATGASAQSECDYMVKSSDARPTCNLYIARDGVIWILAAGATNTSGKGGPLGLSRGVVPLDSANTTTVGMEIGNNGAGEAYGESTIDAAFLASNVINRRLGNIATDLFPHSLYAPDRKIDPATAAAVRGGWKPRSVNGSGSWNVDDIRSEATRRWGTASLPEEDDMNTPACVHLGPDRLDIFARADDGSLRHEWYVDGRWTAWENLGGNAQSSPSASAEALGDGQYRIDVTTRGTDDNVWQITWTGTGWTGWVKVSAWPT